MCQGSRSHNARAIPTFSPKQWLPRPQHTFHAVSCRSWPTSRIQLCPACSSGGIYQPHKERSCEYCKADPDARLVPWQGQAA